MKIFKFLAVAFVAMLGFTACEKDCDHDFIEVDHSKDLVGTWTCFTEDYAEALVINADGSVLSTGVENGEYWENIKGNIKTVNNKMTLTFEDGDNYEGRFEMICGEAFTIFDENGEHLTYRYCENDLSDEIVGMWVCTEEVFGQEEESVGINTYTKDGKSYFTAYISELDGYLNQMESDYKVIGNLLIGWTKATSNSPAMYLAILLDFKPNGTEFGDIMTHYNPIYKTTATFLRIKQHLELPGTKYDYIKTFVTNVKGLDKDIEFMGTTFNFAKMDGVKLDKMLKTLLFAVEFPDANTIKYSCHYNNQPMSMEAPIAVDGNKMTVKMSEKNPAYKDVDLYTFQDQDNTQMHMYMHSTAFVNFFGNMQVTIMEQMGLLDTTDAAAVKAVFDSIDDAVETINVSFVMTRAK